MKDRRFRQATRCDGADCTGLLTIDREQKNRRTYSKRVNGELQGIHTDAQKLPMLTKAEGRSSP